MDQNELRFYKRREAEALRMAEDAKSPGIEAIHREMARRYGEMAKTVRPEHARPTLSIVNRN